ncbi:MAG: type II secretion system F family protein [Armatimonadota bacterium]
MPNFIYKAKNKSGEIVTGTVEAADSRSAAGKIREMGCWPLELREERTRQSSAPSQSAGFAAFWSGVSLRSLAVFFRQMATMIKAGMSISESLDSVGRQKGTGRIQVLAVRAAEYVRNGGMLSNFFAMYPRVFTPIQIGLVRIGETSGAMDSMIEQIACYLERELEIRRKFSKITLYPKIVGVFIIAAALFLRPVSKVGEIIDQGWPRVQQILTSELLPVLLVCAILYFLIKVLLLIPPIRYGWDSLKISFPVLGEVARKLAIARFTSAFSIMCNAGVPLAQAVELGSDAVGNVVISRALKSSIPQLREGGHLSDALARTGKIPEMVLGMMTTGEKTGSMDLVMDKVSEYYSNEAEATLEKFGYLLLVMLIVAAGIIAFMILKDFYTEYYGGNYRGMGS